MCVVTVCNRGERLEKSSQKVVIFAVDFPLFACTAFARFVDNDIERRCENRNSNRNCA